MLDMTQIESFYPKQLRAFKRNILREYLQYKILEIIFDSEYSDKLAFMGGTASRIIYDNTRFSEDLDFDNLGLDKEKFNDLSIIIKRSLELGGYAVEIKNTLKGAFRCYVKLPGLLFEQGLSQHKDETIMIHVDTEPQNFDYQADKIILNKFDVFLRINVVPIDVLLSQKIYAIFHRKRTMGRDFYDTVFLLGRTKPNMDYLREKMGIKSGKELEDKILKFCMKLNFEQLAKDVEPFLFDPNEAKKVLMFSEYIKGNI
ncbi:MAG: nucleotidyl transferase AbiEii/AbiGii toxin family protein [Elusimicrobiota bacterium]